MYFTLINKKNNILCYNVDFNSLKDIIYKKFDCEWCKYTDNLLDIIKFIDMYDYVLICGNYVVDIDNM